MTMHLEIALNRYVGALHHQGHDFDAIAFALAECAVDALIAAGFRNAALDAGLTTLMGAMRERAAELRAMRAPPAPRLVELDGGATATTREQAGRPPTGSNRSRRLEHSSSPRV
jgi:hypothetical protein